MPNDLFVTKHVVSADGTRIAHEVIGAGPDLVIVHGVARMARDYRALASALASEFTVHLMERRGRGESGPQGEGYAIERECDDLRALLAATGARYLFGHSFGGLVALETVLDTPVDKLALYEPGVSIHGSLSMEWLPEFEAALGRGSHADAMAILIKSLGMVPELRHVPLWAVKAIARLLSLKGGEEQKGTIQCLPALPREFREACALDSDGERYRAVRCDTLLLAGETSPAYLLDAIRTLATIIPHARLTILPKLGHNAPDLQAPDLIAGELRRFFRGA
jgi:pimeloyl-ACP methyl ester carboxylesterase